MKKTLPFFCALLCAGALVSCSTQLDDMQLSTPTDKIETGNSDSDQFFPVEDDAVALEGTCHQKSMQLLHAGNPEQALTLYDTKITEEQYQEIKDYVDKIVVGMTSQKAIHDCLLTWVYNSIEYTESDNDPYPVFKNRKGICQGKSNLLKVMLLSQNIPVVSVNGFAWGQGHAWLYTCLDGVWYLSDPTNNFSMPETDPSCNDMQPYFLEWTAYEDDKSLVEYSGNELTLIKVKSGDTKYTVPYSAGGFVLTAFNPESALPENIREVYIGKNIVSIGYQGVIGLKVYGKNIEQVHVDPANPYLEEYEGVVYLKEGDTHMPYYIPEQIKRIVLKPYKIYGKGVVGGHQNVEEIVFPEGVEAITDYAVEDCPKLKRIYVPENAVLGKRAFRNVPQDCEVIRQKTETGIPTITVD